MKNFYKISLFLLAFITSFLFSTTFASSVNAGVDDTRSSGDYDLNGTYQGLTGCGLSVTWGSILHIENSSNLTTAYIPEDALTLATGGNYQVKLKIFTDGLCEDVSDSYMPFEDIMTLCVPNDGFSCPGGGAGGGGGGGSSRHNRMREDATHIFATQEAIDNVRLNLTKHIVVPKVLFELDWNYIGGEGEIKYEIEYSTGMNFDTTGSLDIHRSQIVTRRSYNIYLNDLDSDSIIHYFRVRAFYHNKYSKRSNIIEYIDENNPLSRYNINCIGCTNMISFMDVMFNPEVLIEANFNTSCNFLGGIGCTRDSIKYNDIFDNLDDFVVEDNEPTCVDGVQNGDETDVDCGGGCFACDIGKSCIDPVTQEAEDNSCRSNVCGGEVCDICRDDTDFPNIDMGCTASKPECSTESNPNRCVRHLSNNNINPNADFTITDSIVDINELVSLDAHASYTLDPRSNIIGYRWYIDGRLSKIGIVQSVNFFTMGNHEIKLKVVDNNGLSGSITKTIEVINNTLPFAHIKEQQSRLNFGDMISFDGSDSHDASNSALTEYRWYFSADQAGIENGDLMISSDQSPIININSRALWLQLTDRDFLSPNDKIFVTLEVEDRGGRTSNYSTFIIFQDLQAILTQKRADIERYIIANPNQDSHLIDEIDGLFIQSQISLSYEYLGNALLHIKQAFGLINHGPLRDVDVFEKIIEDITKYTYNYIGTFGEDRNLLNSNLISNSLDDSKSRIDDGQYLYALNKLIYTYFLIINYEKFTVYGDELSSLHHIIDSMNTYVLRGNTTNTDEISEIKTFMEQHMLWKVEELQDIDILMPNSSLELILDLQDISKDLHQLELSGTIWVRDWKWEIVQLTRLFIYKFSNDLLSSKLSDQHYLIQGIENIYNMSHSYLEGYNIDILYDIYSGDPMKCLVLKAYKQANFISYIDLIDYGCNDQ